MQKPTDDIKISSTTVRLSDYETKCIDEFIIAGYCASRARFVQDAMKNFNIKLTRDLLKILPTVKEKYDDPIDRLNITKESLKLRYSLSTSLENLAREKPKTQVNINLSVTYLEYTLNNVKFYLDIDTLQEALRFVISLEIDDMQQYLHQAAELEKMFPKVFGRRRYFIEAEDINNILVESGLKGPDDES